MQELSRNRIHKKISLLFSFNILYFSLKIIWLYLIINYLINFFSLIFTILFGIIIGYLFQSHINKFSNFKFPLILNWSKQKILLHERLKIWEISNDEDSPILNHSTAFYWLNKKNIYIGLEKMLIIMYVFLANLLYLNVWFLNSKFRIKLKFNFYLHIESSL